MLFRSGFAPALPGSRRVPSHIGDPRAEVIDVSPGNLGSLLGFCTPIPFTEDNPFQSLVPGILTTLLVNTQPSLVVGEDMIRQPALAYAGVHSSVF